MLAASLKHPKNPSRHTYCCTININNLPVHKFTYRLQCELLSAQPDIKPPSYRRENKKSCCNKPNAAQLTVVAHNHLLLTIISIMLSSSCNTKLVQVHQINLNELLQTFVSNRLWHQLTPNRFYTLHNLTMNSLIGKLLIITTALLANC